jgi:hypothetical protein
MWANDTANGILWRTNEVHCDGPIVVRHACQRKDKVLSAVLVLGLQYGDDSVSKSSHKSDELLNVTHILA